MSWPPEISPDLPAPRDDEPESLRRDIADELADHLQSAFVRELHATRDEAAAKDKVLDRFGNPNAIARKLWFDAMKEKIMSQRVTLAVTTAMALACLTATGMGWVLVQQGREANRLLIEQSREFNESVLAALNRLGTTPAAAASPEWNPLKVRLVIGKTDGPPAVGFSATFSKHEQNNPISIQEKSGADGVVDFGLQRPGQCGISIQSPWGEATYKYFYLRAGMPHDEVIVCPAAAPPLAGVSLRAELPEDLREQSLFLAIALTQQGRKFDETYWSPAGFAWGGFGGPGQQQAGGAYHFGRAPVQGWGSPSAQDKQNLVEHTLLVDGKIVLLDSPTGWQFTPAETPAPNTGFMRPVWPDVFAAELNLDEAIEPRGQLKWPAATYTVSQLAVCRWGPNVINPPETRSQRSLVVLGATTGYFEPGQQPARLNVAADSENVLRIELPDDLLKIVRKNLAEASAGAKRAQNSIQ